MQRRTLKQALVTLMLGALVLPISAQSLDSIVAVRQAVEGDTLRLVIETKDRVPDASAYFLTAPDRLVVELNDALPRTTVSGKPAASMVSSWSLKQSALNRSRLVVSLNYRPPHSSLKLTTLTGPPRLLVESSTQMGVNEKLALTEGIDWIREDKLLAGRWTRFNRLLFDPKDPNLEVVVGLANENTSAREALSSMVARYDAVAGINGGFFAGGGGALGLIYREGKMLAPHVSRRPPRSGFGLTRDGKALFGRIAATGTAIKDLDGGDWSGAWLALGGGPRLLQNGMPKLTTDLEELGPKGNDITRVAARTVVGLAENDRLLFATVSGYHDNHREGAQFGPLVTWLKSVGVKEAVNFDGGASVDMVVGKHIVSDGPANASKEKPVATALLVRDKRERLFPESAQWTLERQGLPADGKSETELVVSLLTAAGRSVPDGTPVRFFARGIAVDPASTQSKDGKVRVKLRAVHNPGTASVTLMCGPLTEHKTFSLQAGEARRVMVQQAGAALLEKTPNTQKVTLKVQTLDQWGNPVGAEAFTCSVDGGATSSFTTDGRGMMALEVELPSSGGLFTVQHSSGSVTHRVPALRNTAP